MSFTILQPSETPGVKPPAWEQDWANKLPTDGPAVITPTVVNPNIEGTPDAFGGTAGITSYKNPNLGRSLPQLPSTPYAKRQNEKGTSVPTNILNDKTLFSYSDYNTMMLSRGKDKLQHLGNKANQYLLQRADSKRFYNLPLGEIINRTVLTVVAVFVDLLHLIKQDKLKNMNFQEKAKVYANVFIVKDRMVYIGVFFIFMSLLFMVVFLSS